MLYDQSSPHDFSMIPRSEIPRSMFDLKATYKTAFDAGMLVPVYCEEMLPGDNFRGAMHAIARLATPITPFMDDLTFESFFFFVPNRLVWDNWVKMMGERKNPSDSIAYALPTVTCPAGGYAVSSLYDYFGLPTVGQVVGGGTITHQNLPARMYNLIYNEWFRDQNLINAAVVDTDDGPDDPADYVVRRRGKRHDYISSCLPWPQKGDAVSLPLGASAPVNSDGTSFYWLAPGSGGPTQVSSNTGGAGTAPTMVSAQNPATAFTWGVSGASTTGLYADLSSATAATINAIRLAFQVQRLLERDARGGTRYTESILAHFGVRSPDMRLQRPEYIGGGSTPIVINGVVQNSATDATTPQGNLAATGTMITMGGHDFNYASTEHGYIIGLVNVRAELTYQQGMRRHWSRSTRYDYYYPAFAHLGEQAVLNREVYCDGSANDDDVFGYQERFGELRFMQSQITGLLRSIAAGTLNVWHLAQHFASLPTLNQTFIEENPPVDRVVAVPSPTGRQFIFDALFLVRSTRPLPMYGVPGLIDHF